MTEKYIVRLTAEEREELTALAQEAKAKRRSPRSAMRVLLKADADGPNSDRRPDC
ncbi:MAG: hypothetical protein U1F42_02565 [Candidatus Competibacteraceae bacterium]